MALRAGQASLRAVIAQAGQGTGRRSKYGAVRTTVDGVTFASKKEARRWSELVLLRQADQIFSLIRQPRYGLYIKPMHSEVDQIKVADYVGDFQYYDKAGQLILEDVKGGAATKTAVYRLKRKIVEALYGIRITEV